jgi:DNA-binding transcriptional LysR family regulator
VSTGLDFRQLRAFHAVASARAFGRASKVLGVGQPAISKAIATMERELGVALFERHATGVVLTEVGEQIFSVSSSVFENLARIQEVVEAGRGALKGELSVTSNEHVASYLLSEVIKTMRADHPMLTTRVSTGPAQLLIRELLEGRAEFGLFFKVDEHAAVDRMVLASVPCQFVVKAGSARDPEVLEAFIGSREIDDVGNKAFPSLAYLKNKRPKTRIAVSCNSLEAHKAFVLQGIGISVLPRFVVEAELQSGSLELVHPTYVYKADLSLVTRKGKILSRAARAFLSELKRTLTA